MPACFDLVVCIFIRDGFLISFSSALELGTPNSKLCSRRFHKISLKSEVNQRVMKHMVLTDNGRYRKSERDDDYFQSGKLFSTDIEG